MDDLILQELKERVSLAGRPELRIILSRILEMPLPESTLQGISRIILGPGAPSLTKDYCQISKHRSIPVKLMRELSGSPLLPFLPLFIKAAQRKDGPFQTRDIMMVAANDLDGLAFWMTPKGIPKRLKIHLGYMLILAGFERKSHLDKGTRQPIKAWKLAKGEEAWTDEQRVALVHSRIDMELGKQTEDPKKDLPSVESFI